MYIGNLGDFFSKDKNWLINQPKITIENKYQFLKMGGKIFKLDIYTGVLYEIKNNNKHQLQTKLDTKQSGSCESLKKNKTNNNFNIINKNKHKIFLSNEKYIFNQSLDKRRKKELNKIKNKSSNIKSNFSLTSRNFNKKKVDKPFNIYLNKKYALKGIINKRNKSKNEFEKTNYLTFDINNKNKLKNKLHNFPSLKIKKTINSDNDSDNIFIQDDDDICEVKKDDNKIIEKVKDQIFKAQMFKILQKKYNFYKEDKNSFIKIPKLRLDNARNIYVNKRYSLLKKIYLNKTDRNKSINKDIKLKFV